MRTSGASAAFILVGVACTGPRVPEPGASKSPPVELAFGLSSRARVADVRAQLGADASWIVSERRSPARGRCSRFDQINLNVPRFYSNGFTGSLRLDFINGRLFKVVFFPEDPAKYIDWLGTHGVMLTAAGIGFPSDGVSVMVSPAGVDPRFVAWTDMKLEGEVSRWILACS